MTVTSHRPHATIAASAEYVGGASQLYPSPATRVDVKTTSDSARMAERRRSLAARLNRLIDWLNANRIGIFVTTLAVSFVMLAAVVFASAIKPHSVQAAQPTPRPIMATATPVATPTPIALRTVTADSLNAAMRSDSQTVVTSIEPLPQQQAGIHGQVVITAGLVAASISGWYDDNIAGQSTYTCPDSVCGVYDANQVTYLCGGWAGIDGDKMTPNLSVIHSVHTCVEATRISAADRSSAALMYISQSARRALIGNTDRFPLLLIEVYRDKPPFPAYSNGK